jgi:hypothetical protein
VLLKQRDQMRGFGAKDLGGAGAVLGDVAGVVA